MRHLTKEKVMRLTGLSARTIERWSRDGRFPKHVAFGARSVRWAEADVRKWLASQRTPAASGSG